MPDTVIYGHMYITRFVRARAETHVPSGRSDDFSSRDNKRQQTQFVNVSLRGNGRHFLHC